ncbi:type III secretion protein [Tabrizicola piscis]|uniref:Type III secretion protein n=1 Tax=Tabrizicola piscis TaxID=2494374 RepID=A0A3S8U774_9RHOB|nr:flagellar biosynthetic protein FliR [Tabrizicola piscis]AZL59451.1 type III secretion protein [Tabrizicola piscis]
MNGILTELGALLDMAEGLLWAAALVFVRAGAVVALMPGFGEMVVPQRVKLALILCFAAVVAPVLAPEIEAFGPDPGLAPLLGEAVAGLILGIGMRLFLLALQTAAAIIAQATTLSQLFVGAAPEPQPAIGSLFLISGIALALGAGLHIKAVELLILSYDILPAGGYPEPRAVADWGVGLASQTFSLAFTLAAPFIIASMIYNLALGAINRAMPQLMVAMVGAPALTLGGLALLAVTTPLLLAVWLHAFEAFLASPFAVAQ